MLKLVISMLICLNVVSSFQFDTQSSKYQLPDWYFTKNCTPVINNLVPINIQDPIFQNALDNFTSYAVDWLKLQIQLGIPIGMSIGAIYNGDVIYSENFGTLSKNSTVPVTSDSIYRIGSVSKIFTTYMFNDLLDQGAVTMDSQVSEFYNEENPPAFKVINPWINSKNKKKENKFKNIKNQKKEMEDDQYAKITLSMLASHTSGLPRVPPCEIQYGQVCFDNETAIIDGINEAGLMFPPLTKAHYSNTATALLGRSLARAINMSYEDYLQIYVFDKLGMTNSGIYINETVEANMVVGYDVATLQPSPVNTLDIGWETPAGGIYSSLNDMLTFVDTILGTASGRLSTDTLEISQEYMNHYLRVPGFLFNDDVTAFGSALWETIYSNGYHVITKDGELGGYTSCIGLIPDLQLGVVILFNADFSLPDILVASFMDNMIPALSSYLLANQPVPALPTNYQNFIGNYTAFGVVMGSITTLPNYPGHLILNFGGDLFLSYWDSALDKDSFSAFSYFLLNDQDHSCIGDYSSTMGYFYVGSDLLFLPDSNLELTLA